MRIAMVSLYLPSGSKIGSGYQAHLLANALVDRGHEVDMYSPCPAPPDARYSVCHIDNGNRLRTFRFAFSLRSVDFRSYDVLHTHGDDYLLFGRQRPAHVRTMHGSCFAEAIHIHGVKERTRMTLLGVSEVLIYGRGRSNGRGLASHQALVSMDSDSDPKRCRSPSVST